VTSEPLEAAGLAIPPDSELGTLLWDANEVAARTVGLIEARVIGPVHSDLAGSPTALPPTLYRKYASLVSRINLGLEKLRAALQDIGRLSSIDLRARAVIGATEDFRRTVFALLRTESLELEDSEDAPPPVVALRRVIVLLRKSLSRKFDIVSLEDIRFLEATDAVEAGRRLLPTDLFLEGEEDVSATATFDNSTPENLWEAALRSTGARDTMNVHPLRRAWSDDELFQGEFHCPQFHVFQAPSPDDILASWDRYVEVLVGGFESWKLVCAQNFQGKVTVLAEQELLDDAAAEGLSDIGILNFMQKNFEIWLKTEVRTIVAEFVGGKTTLWHIEWERFIEGLKPIIENWCRLRNGPAPGYGPMIDSFVSVAFATQEKTPALLAPRHRGEHVLACFPSRDIGIKSGDLDGFLYRGERGVACSLSGGDLESHVNALMPKELCPNEMFGEIRTRVLPRLRASVVAKVEPLIPGDEVVFQDLDGFVQFMKQVFILGLEAIEAFSAPDIPSDVLAVVKNGASRHLAWMTRVQAFEASVATTLPDKGTYQSELATFFPEVPADVPTEPTKLPVPGNERASRKHLSAWWEQVRSIALRRLTVTVQGTSASPLPTARQYRERLSTAIGSLDRARGNAAFPTSPASCTAFTQALRVHIQGLPGTIDMQGVVLTVPGELGAFLLSQVTLLDEDIIQHEWLGPNTDDVVVSSKTDSQSANALNADEHPLEEPQQKTLWEKLGRVGRAALAAVGLVQPSAAEALACTATISRREIEKYVADLMKTHETKMALSREGTSVIKGSKARFKVLTDALARCPEQLSRTDCNGLLHLFKEATDVWIGSVDPTWRLPARLIIRTTGFFEYGSLASRIELEFSRAQGLQGGVPDGGETPSTGSTASSSVAISAQSVTAPQLAARTGIDVRPREDAPPASLSRDDVTAAVCEALEHAATQASHPPLAQLCTEMQPDIARALGTLPLTIIDSDAVSSILLAMLDRAYLYALRPERIQDSQLVAGFHSVMNSAVLPLARTFPAQWVNRHEVADAMEAFKKAQLPQVRDVKQKVTEQARAQSLGDQWTVTKENSLYRQLLLQGLLPSLVSRQLAQWLLAHCGACIAPRLELFDTIGTAEASQYRASFIENNNQFARMFDQAFADKQSRSEQQDNVEAGDGSCLPLTGSLELPLRLSDVFAPRSISRAEVRAHCDEALRRVVQRLMDETGSPRSECENSTVPIVEIIERQIAGCPYPVTAREYDKLRALSALRLPVAERVSAMQLPPDIGDAIRGVKRPMSTSTPASSLMARLWKEEMEGVFRYIGKRLNIQYVAKEDVLQCVDAVVGAIHVPRFSAEDPPPPEHLETLRKINVLYGELRQGLPAELDVLLVRRLCELECNVENAIALVYDQCAPQAATTYRDSCRDVPVRLGEARQALFPHGSRETSSDFPSMRRDEFMGHVTATISRMQRVIDHSEISGERTLCSCLGRILPELVRVAQDLPDEVMSSEELGAVFAELFTAIYTAMDFLNSAETTAFIRRFQPLANEIVAPLVARFPYEWAEFEPLVKQVQQHNDAHRISAKEEEALGVAVEYRGDTKHWQGVKDVGTCNQIMLQSMMPRHFNGSLAECFTHLQSSAIRDELAFLAEVGTPEAGRLVQIFHDTEQFTMQAISDALDAQRRLPGSPECSGPLSRETVVRALLAANEEFRRHHGGKYPELSGTLQTAATELLPDSGASLGDFRSLICWMEGVMVGNCVVASHVTPAGVDGGTWMADADRDVRPFFQPVVEQLLRILPADGADGTDGDSRYASILASPVDGPTPVPLETFIDIFHESFAQQAISSLVGEHSLLPKRGRGKRLPNTPLRTELTAHMAGLCRTIETFATQRFPGGVSLPECRIIHGFCNQVVGLSSPCFDRHGVGDGTARRRAARAFMTAVMTRVWKGIEDRIRAMVLDPRKEESDGEQLNGSAAEINYGDLLLVHDVPSDFSRALSVHDGLTNKAVLVPVDSLFDAVRDDPGVMKTLGVTATTKGDCMKRMVRFRGVCRGVARAVAGEVPITTRAEYDRLIGGYGHAIAQAGTPACSFSPALSAHLKDGMLRWFDDIEGRILGAAAKPDNPLAQAVAAVSGEELGLSPAEILARAVCVRLGHQASLLLHRLTSEAAPSADVAQIEVGIVAAAEAADAAVLASVEAVCRGGEVPTLPALIEHLTSIVGGTPLDATGLDGGAAERFRSEVLAATIRDIQQTRDALDFILVGAPDEGDALEGAPADPAPAPSASSPVTSPAGTSAAPAGGVEPKRQGAGASAVRRTLDRLRRTRRSERMRGADGVAEQTHRLLDAMHYRVAALLQQTQTGGDTDAQEAALAELNDFLATQRALYRLLSHAEEP
jgi:hypothetical protein